MKNKVTPIVEELHISLPIKGISKTFLMLAKLSAC